MKSPLGADSDDVILLLLADGVLLVVGNEAGLVLSDLPLAEPRHDGFGAHAQFRIDVVGLVGRLEPGILQGVIVGGHAAVEVRSAGVGLRNKKYTSSW